MPRRRPSRLRAAAQQGLPAHIPGVPVSTIRALDRLGRPELSSRTVWVALKTWQQIAARSRADLSEPHNDWIEFVAPDVRGHLEAALCTLSRHHAAPLRALVQRADQLFSSKTLPSPATDPSQPWWARCWWH